MYVNPAFQTDDDAAWDYVVRRGYGAVIATDKGAPVAAQVPLLVTGTGTGRRIEFHVAGVNPLHEIVVRSPRVLVVVSGPDAYISPDWYTSADQVPTWNYLAAHMTGSARPMAPEAAGAHVEAMSQAFEQRLAPKKPWSTSKMTAARLSAMLRAIVPMEIEVERIEASTKLGQNKTVADRMEVARMLAWRDGWGEAAVAAAMREEIRSQAKAAKEGR